MARLYVLMFLLQIAVAAAALISCLSTEESEINALPRIAWILIILFFPLIGSIAWFVAGRNTVKPRPTGRAGTGFPQRERPLAPDDNPEFLRSLRDLPIERPIPPRPQPKAPEPKASDPKAGDPKAGDPKAGDKAGEPDEDQPRA
jgi:hypothetical protein